MGSKEIEFQSCIEKWAAESIVGNCNANKGTEFQFNQLTHKQIEYAKIRGVEIKDHGCEIHTAIIYE